MTYSLVRDLAADGVPITLTCRVLGFTPQAHRKWRRTPVSDREWQDAHVVDAVLDIHHDDPEFGYRSIADDLERSYGIRVSENGVARLCSSHGIFSRLAKKRHSAKRPGPPVHDDHVRRDFSAEAPNRVWFAEITEHPASEGKLYIGCLKDAWSNPIVGYSMADRMTAELAATALANVVAIRGTVAGTIVHSDRGG